MWISLASVAHHILWFARTNPERPDPHDQLSAFIIETDRPGVTRGDIHGKLGLRAGSTGWVHCQDVRVPVANRLGEEGEGFRIAMSALDNGRYTVAAGATGLIRAALEASVRYASERKTFGRAIGRHQLVQQKIARMARDYELARLAWLQVGWMKNEGLRNTRQVSLAKWFATDASFDAANEAIQVHGSYGYSDEYDVERYLRNSKAAVIYEGTSEIHQLMQAGYALGYREDGELRCELPAYDEAIWRGREMGTSRSTSTSTKSPLWTIADRRPMTSTVTVDADKQLAAAGVPDFLVLFDDQLRGEANFGQQAQPGVATEQSHHVPVVDRPRRAVALQQQVRHVHDEVRVAGIGVVHPLDIAQAAAAAVGCVVTAVVGVRAKLSRVSSGQNSATPPGLVWTNAVTIAWRRSSSLVRYATASWTKTASNWRSSRTVRMSPCTCSHSGFSARLTASICGDRSTSVSLKCALRCEALLPPPLPSSSTSTGGCWQASTSVR